MASVPPRAGDRGIFLNNTGHAENNCDAPDGAAKMQDSGSIMQGQPNEECIINYSPGTFRQGSLIVRLAGCTASWFLAASVLSKGDIFHQLHLCAFQGYRVIISILLFALKAGFRGVALREENNMTRPGCKITESFSRAALLSWEPPVWG